MKYCPNSLCSFFLENEQIAQYLDSAVVCPICQSMLTAEWPEFALVFQKEADDGWLLNDEGERLLVLATYLHPKQAQLLQNRFQANNLLTYLAQQVIELEPFAEAIGNLRLLIKEADFEQAITILELYGDE